MIAMATLTLSLSLSGDHGDGAAMANNSTMAVPLSTANSLSLESGVEVDESLIRRSPLVRTLAPIFGFFKSRAGERVAVDRMSIVNIDYYSRVYVKVAYYCAWLHCSTSCECMPLFPGVDCVLWHLVNALWGVHLCSTTPGMCHIRRAYCCLLYLFYKTSSCGSCTATCIGFAVVDGSPSTVP